MLTPLTNPLNDSFTKCTINWYNSKMPFLYLKKHSQTESYQQQQALRVNTHGCVGRNFVFNVKSIRTKYLNEYGVFKAGADQVSQWL